MRRFLVVAVLLPAIYAISLSTFQFISPEAPKICQNTYNSEISSCSPNDFTEICSTQCVVGLNAIAQKVSSACKNFQIDPNTLASVVLGGGIVENLCSRSQLKSSTVSNAVSLTKVSKSTTLDPQSATEPACSKPLNSQDLGSSTLFLTISEIQTPLFEPKITSSYSLILSNSISSTSRPVITTTPKTSIISDFGDISTSTKLSSLQPSPSSPANDPKTPSLSEESGGGSPFDNQNFKSSANNPGKTSLCAMVMALLWACILQR